MGGGEHSRHLLVGPAEAPGPPKVRFTPAPGYADAVVGQSIDLDSAFAAQCVDLAHHFISVALGIPYPHGFTGNAYPIFDNAPQSSTRTSTKYGTVTFTKMLRSTANSIPLPGDIVFWRNPDPGHVAIVTSANATTISTIDQNWSNSSANGSPAARVNHDNDASVVGWLRPSW